MLPYNLSAERLIANFNNNQTQKNALLMQNALKNTYYYMLATTRHEMEGQPAIVVYNIPGGSLLEVFTFEQGAKDALEKARKEISPDLADTIRKLTADELRLFIEQVHTPRARLTINSSTSPITFTFEHFLQFTAPEQKASEVSEYQAEAGQVMNFTQKAGSLSQDALRLLDRMAGELGYVNRVWVTETEMEGAPILALVFDVDFEMESQEPLIAIAKAMAADLNRTDRVSVILSDEEMAKDVVARLQPAFARH